MVRGMETTLRPDKFWRLVLTAEIRKALGLKRGDKLRARVSGGRLELEPAPIEARKFMKSVKGRVVFTGPIPEGYDAVQAIRRERDSRA